MSKGRFIDTFVKEVVFDSKTPSPSTVEMVKIMARSMIGRNRTIEIQKEGRQQTVTENAEFTIPHSLGEQAKPIRERLFALTEFERTDVYRALSGSNSAKKVLSIAEMSIMEQRPTAYTEEQLREVVSMRIYAVLERFADDLRSLLMHCEVQRTQGRTLRVKPAKEYPIDVIRQIVERAKKLTRPDVTYSETMALLPTKAPAQVEGLTELFGQLRTLQIGTQEDRDSMTKEIVTAKGDIRTQPLLSSLDARIQDIVTDLLVQLRETNANSTSRMEDINKQRALRSTLSAIPPEDLTTVLSSLEKSGGFTQELDGMDERLWKESTKHTESARLLLYSRWHRSADLSLPMKKILMTLSVEWNITAYDRDRRLQRVITPKRYTRETYEAAREMLLSMRDDDFVKALRVDEGLALDTNVIADVQRIRREAYPDDPPDASPGAPAQPAVLPGPTTSVGTVADALQTDPATLLLAETGLVLLRLPTDNAAEIARNARPMRPLEKIHERLGALYNSVEALDHRIEAVRDIAEAGGTVVSWVLQLKSDFQNVIAAMTRSCIMETSTIGSGDSPELSAAEIALFKQMTLHSALDVHTLFRSLPADGTEYEGGLRETVTDSLMSSAAQHIAAVRVQGQWGKRLQRFPVMTDAMFLQLDAMTNDLATAALDHSDDVDPDGESLLKSLSLVIQGLQEMLETDETFDPQQPPLSLLEKHLTERDIPVALSTAISHPKPAAETKEAPERTDRRIIAKYLRHQYHNTRARISFADAREFLRPAGIVAEERNTEHPWYWVCTEGERTGRSAISRGFAANGFFHGSILKLLFGSHDFRGIGNIRTLIDSLPKEWLAAMKQEKSADSAE